MSIKDLMNRWALPDRSGERIQITLRLDFNEYARLHALKEVYPNRSVNDFLNDIIRSGLDEIVAALPSKVYTQEDYEHDFAMSVPDVFPTDIGMTFGLGVRFNEAYRRILEEKAPEETSKEAA